MRRFELHRDEDVSGVSGTGVVAEGLELTDGIVVMRWLGDKPSTVIIDGGMKAVEEVHGHEGKSRVVFIDRHEQDAVDKSLIERCAEVMHDVRSSTPWQHVSDWDKDTQRLAAGAMLDYLDEKVHSDG